jgi:hypothetical protein
MSRAVQALIQMFGICISSGANELFIIDIALDDIMIGIFTNNLSIP